MVYSTESRGVVFSYAVLWTHSIVLWVCCSELCLGVLGDVLLNCDVLHSVVMRCVVIYSAVLCSVVE